MLAGNGSPGLWLGKEGSHSLTPKDDFEGVPARGQRGQSSQGQKVEGNKKLMPRKRKSQRKFAKDIEKRI